MKQIQDHSLFMKEFQKLIDSERFTNMKIDEDENGAVIHLGKQYDVTEQKKRAELLEAIDETAGILRKYPTAVRKEFHLIAAREGEDDREDIQIGKIPD